jgi:hypothetical protein
LEGYIIEFSMQRTTNIFQKKKSYSKKEPEEDCCGKSPFGLKFFLWKRGCYLFQLRWKHKPLHMRGGDSGEGSWDRF